MAETKQYTVYQFNELSDRAKDTARQWYRDASQGDNYFAESVIEDAAQIADLLGIEDAETVRELLRDFMRWIYHSLEREYDYQNSDEVVDETIRANEYTFDEDGNRED